MHTTTGPSPRVFHALQRLTCSERASLTGHHPDGSLAVDGDPHVAALQRQALDKLAGERITHLDALEAIASVQVDLENLRARMSPGAYAEMIQAMAQLYDERNQA